MNSWEPKVPPQEIAGPNNKALLRETNGLHSPLIIRAGYFLGGNVALGGGGP